MKKNIGEFMKNLGEPPRDSLVVLPVSPTVVPYLDDSFLRDTNEQFSNSDLSSNQKRIRFEIHK